MRPLLLVLALVLPALAGCAGPAGDVPSREIARAEPLERGVEATVARPAAPAKRRIGVRPAGTWREASRKGTGKVRGTVVATLDDLGVTVAGVYTPASLTPWTTNIDGGGFNLSNAGNITLASSKSIHIDGYYGAGGRFLVYRNADATFTSTGETVSWSGEDQDQPAGVNLGAQPTWIFSAPVAGTAKGLIKVRIAADADPFDLILKRFNSGSVEQTGRGDREDSWFQGDGSNAFTVITPFCRHLDAGDSLRLQVFTPGTDVVIDDGGSAATLGAMVVGHFVPD
jgi:hypothetical protein